MFAGPTAPVGYLTCNGDTLNVSDYPDLFAVISNIYGGDGVDTFQLPNMSCKAPFGIGTWPSLPDVNLGETQGNNITTLITQTTRFLAPIDGSTPVVLNEIVNTQGNNVVFDNMPLSLGLNFCICVQ